MGTNFTCSMCGEAAVTARVDEDGLERMYCAFHIVTSKEERDDLLCDTIAEQIPPECSADPMNR